ncbi:helix-turn-helix transcriptional regulator [Streptomyces olivaceus]|uniref:helix-turn-helix transcriptional regulator n=1 Tax=Streptomyces olivaceus TaxID=47716 RepID=UPI000878B1E6|nr:LuxR family transcriptional regulator [Streptomyces olivaceus]AOW90526.1 helix-turn-helix transcriptional regulator [Streptomyces olivaceus]MBZ6304057.1 LuxR C-terminal-related transcriptional regulator [Streptomyces olivaceus]MBZ6318513.1 LuxR C-terminal-related transcriptional regulator [Streptomyces olivaceus]
MTGETTVSTAARIHGRSAQRRVLRALLDQLPTRGGPLLVTGEPGLGRTALLTWAAGSFRTGPVFRPAPVREPDGAGPTAGELLAVLRAAARQAPALVCVDDAHLLDTAARAALGHAAECLPAADRVGLLVSVAGHRAVDPDFAHLPTLRLDPLTPPQAAALLDDATDGAADPAVRERLVAEAEGNPALLLALVRRLSPAELRGRLPLPAPLADAATLAAVAGGAHTGRSAAAGDLLLTVAAAVRASDGPDVDAGLVLDAVRRLRTPYEVAKRPEPPADPPDPPESAAVPGPREALPEQLAQGGDRLRFHSALVRRTVHATAAPERRRAVHRALAEAVENAGRRLPGLLHRSWSLTGPAPAPDLADRLASAAGDGAVPAPYGLRATAYARAADLTADGATRAERYTAAAEQYLLAGRPDRARPLLGAARARAAPAAVRGRAELVRGLTELRDGPVGDAHQSLLLAASLLAGDAPADAATAALAAADAAWAAGDLEGCLATLAPGSPRAGEPAARPHTGAEPPGKHPTMVVRDHGAGMRALLQGRLDRAAAPLGQVVERGGTDHRPEALLRSAAAALLLGNVDAARRAGARALAAARQLGSETLVPQALEYLAYAELRAGRHPQARAHAEEGLRVALRTGQRNTAAHHRAVLALAASIEEDPDTVARHVTAALSTARRHGLAQAATLAQWAEARADLGRGRPFEAADRLGLLVLPGPGRGHFAVWRLAVPCFVEAAVLAGRHEDAAGVLTDFADWAAFGADRQAAAQLARCRALLAPPEGADGLYRRALDRHDEAGGDFERARTALLYGKWLRRRRRPREARDRLGTALAGFERSGAGVWAAQARDELRALGAAPHERGSGALTRLTPQQLRIARHVAEGATNREVALTLAVSTRTVDYHLRRVFAALGVRSRLELARVVGQAERAGPAEKTGARP